MPEEQIIKCISQECPIRDQCKRAIESDNYEDEYEFYHPGDLCPFFVERDEIRIAKEIDEIIKKIESFPAYNWKIKNALGNALISLGAAKMHIMKPKVQPSDFKPTSKANGRPSDFGLKRTSSR